MKYTLILALATSLIGTPFALQASVIPLPAEMLEQDGSLSLGAPLEITHSKLSQPKASWLDEKIKKHWITKGSQPVTISFIDTPSLSDTLGTEGYKLSINASGIQIEAAASSGHFYAIQTLLQLAETKGETTHIPYTTIKDCPRFSYRGLMLDEARHFMGKEYVKHLLDTMAAHKMNRFHWHLTDDQGWRIEIKSYPKLTSVGSHRGEGTSIPTPDWDKAKKTDPDGPKYSGHYSQEDIKEIVAYAKERHIEIIPEIDVPGHAYAIAVAYPETLPKADQDTGTGVHGYKGNVISVVREENYVMLDRIFGEIAALFPSKYIHVGGDEVNVNAWKASPEHRAYMKEHGLSNPHQLQNMFMLRLEKILKKHNRTMMGWNEIMHGGNLSQDTAVVAWISAGAGINAARKGHPTIMAPGPHCYFDMKYPGHSETGHWWAGIVSTERAYNWNPLFNDQLKPEQQKNILGLQCALWTEFVPDQADADYKFWPRACATAEVAWTPQDKREWSDFNQRLGEHLDYLDNLQVKYRIAPPSATQSKGEVTIVPPYPNAKVLYTLDGTDPKPGTAKSYLGKPISISHLSNLRYRHLRGTDKLSKVERGANLLPVFTWSDKQQGSFEVDLSSVIDRAGPWVASFAHTGGKNDMNFSSISILENGKTVATGSPVTVGKNKRRQSMRLLLENFSPGAKYTLKLETSANGPQCRGNITFDRSPFNEPAQVRVESKVPAYGNHQPQKITDWDRQSYFWASRNGQKGDFFLIHLDPAVKLRSIIIPTGKLGSNEDIIQKGMIEISEDGENFLKVADFNLGTAAVEFDEAKTVKTIKITLTQNQGSWFIIQDPQLK